MQALLARFSTHTFLLFFIIMLSQITACDLTETVSPDDESPRLIFETEVTVTENTSGTIYTATTDVTNPSFSLAATDDSSLFTISTAGELSFVTAPQFNEEGDNAYSVQIQINDESDVIDTLINVAVNVIEFNPAPSLTDAAAQSYTQNSAISVLSFVNTGGGLLTSCTSDTLPTGLQVAISADGSTCEISGTPTAIQAATTHTISATNDTGSSSASVSITVNVAAPSLADALAQTFTQNNSISTLSFANSGGGLISSCTADTLPTGLQVNVSADSTTCEISGTPTALQAATIHTITATNSTGNSSATVSISVVVETPSLLDATNQNYTQDSAISTLSFTNNGGGLLTSCTADTLPAGLLVGVSADLTTCEITGTPTTLQAATVHMITATNDSGNSTASVTITVSIAPPTLVDASAQIYTTNIAIPTLSFTNSGGGDLTNCTADTLPAGLSVGVSSDASTCEITGTPTASQAITTHTITATNASGNSSASVDITVNLGLALPDLANPAAQTYITEMTIPTLSFTNNGGGSLTNCTADTLPAGLSVNVSADTSTCEITGSPTAAQAATSHTITATNASGSSNASVRITVILAVPFTTQWQTDNPGTSANNEITISTNSSLSYNYHVDWGDGNTDNNVTGDITHTYSGPGTYTVAITGNFPQIFFNATGNDPEKLLSVDQWGNQPWQSMESAFRGCSNLSVNATDTPDLSLVTNMSDAFNGATAFNQDISNWDVSSVTNMSGTFRSTTTFNQPLSGWNVSAVTDMSEMFRSATVFNQDISGWDVSSVTDMGDMFNAAAAFNQDISNWNVSAVTDMSGLFSGATVFNQDISGWDVSSVTDMSSMLISASAFNQPIGSWNVSSVTNMNRMLANTAAFNQDISGWDVSSVTDMSRMFDAASVFNQPIGSWNVSSVTNLSFMFNNATVFNQNINGWDVSSATDMSYMFFNAHTFNQPVGSWDVSSVTTMRIMFSRAFAFNQDLSSWDVSSVTDMRQMFGSASVFNQDISGWNVSAVTDMVNMFNDTPVFNQNIGSWNVSAVTNMIGMFSDALVFDQDISGWNVSAVTNMSNMFNGAASFNQNINNWNVSSVTNMSGMFLTADLFNQPLGNWTVSAVTDMSSMFSGAGEFNQDLSSWNVSAVTTMAQMFQSAESFNQNIGAWVVTSVTDMNLMFDGTSLSVANYDALLIGWSGQAVQSNVAFSGGASNFSTVGAPARDILTGTFNWTITDGGPEPQ